MRRPGRSILNPFLHHLAKHLGEGCGDAMALWRELPGVGYAHGPRMVQRWVAENRTRPAPRTVHKWLPAQAPAAPDVAPTPGPALLSPKQLTWLLVRPAATLSPADAVAVRWVEQNKKAALVSSLARRFTVLVRSCEALQPTRPAAPLNELEAWLAEAKACGIGPAGTFTVRLEVDGVAVRAL